MSDIPERDWKVVRSLKDEIIERACQRILDKAENILQDNDKNAHTKFIDLGDMYYIENDLISRMFDDLSRSRAIMQVSLWKANGLLTHEQFMSFSEESRKNIEKLAKSIEN